jgi:hypothetical protein
MVLSWRFVVRGRCCLAESDSEGVDAVARAIEAFGDVADGIAQRVIR